MKVVVEQDKCVSSGQCVLFAADVFDQREQDGIVTLLNDNPPPELHQAVRDAAEVCPALAIAVLEQP